MRNCAGVSARVGKSWLVAEEVVRVSWGERGELLMVLVVRESGSAFSERREVVDSVFVW